MFRIRLPFPLQFAHCSISHPCLTHKRPLINIISASTALCPLLHLVLSHVATLLTISLHY